MDSCSGALTGPSGRSSGFSGRPARPGERVKGIDRIVDGLSGAFLGSRHAQSAAVWVLGIARKESIRRLSRKPLPTVSLTDKEGKTIDVPATEPVPSEPADDWLSKAVDAAMAAGHLSEQEKAVLTAATDGPRPNWPAVGASLGWKPARCAVVCFRAIGKLRVFLFLHRPQFLGGSKRIAAAFDDARRLSGPAGLTAEQAHVFQRMVIAGDHGYRTVGWRSHLAEACARVVRFLEPEAHNPF